jgi:catechol 2,3-dioxygenase
MRDPEELEAAGAPAHGEIAAETSVGSVHLTVADLQRSLSFYDDAFGMERLGGGDGRAALGAGGRELLVLVEEAGAGSAAGHTGLYHFALLLPERADLAAWLDHAVRDRIGLTGLSDHFVSEALYLRDPDGHGIEVYRDRPREDWEGQVAERMTSLPLDVQDLMGALPENAKAGSYSGLPAGTVMGHVHLKVASIPETIAFYRDVLGFGLMAGLGAEAAFLSAGGYHHHIGANTWESAGASPAPARTAALRHATFVLPGEAKRDAVLARAASAGHEPEQDEHGSLLRDPSGNGIVLAIA